MIVTACMSKANVDTDHESTSTLTVSVRLITVDHCRHGVPGGAKFPMASTWGYRIAILRIYGHNI